MAASKRERKAEALVKRYVANILAVYLDADELTQAAGREWYALESERCRAWGARHGLTRVQVAGAAAAISPGMRWSLVFSYLEALRVDPSASVPTYSREFVRRAVHCLNGGDPREALSGPKVTAFYDLLAGGSGGVVIDRHAFDICRGVKAGVREGGQDGQVTPSRYRLAARAYREAAEVLGETPHAVQATTWIHWRRAHGARVEWASEREPGEE